MNRLIRRAIHHWLAWKSRRNLVRDMERRKRDMMTRALGGQR